MTTETKRQEKTISADDKSAIAMDERPAGLVAADADYQDAMTAGRRILRKRRAVLSALAK